MTLKSSFPKLDLPVKYYLSSYRACLDCQLAIENLKTEKISYSHWKVQWAGVCSLMKASIHLMGNKDAKSCLPDKLKDAFKNKWNELRKNRSNYPIFWEFIHRERNNILKEYDFSAYEAVLSHDGSFKSAPVHGLLAFMSDEVKRTLAIRGGAYDGKHAIALLSEAIEWIESTIFDTIRAAGYDPEKPMNSEKFIVRESLISPKGLLALPEITED